MERSDPHERKEINPEPDRKVRNAKQEKPRYNRKSDMDAKKESAIADPRRGGLKLSSTGGPKQPYTVEKILSDWDRMLLAKYLPGQVEAPYCAGQNILPVPTSTFRTSLAISRCPDTTTGIDSAPVSLGSATYCMMAFCPLISTHLGTGTAGAFATTTRLSGFQVLQGNSLSTAVLYQDGFNRVPRALSCLELYGSDFQGFASSGAVWASEINLSILTPAANLVGSVYEGALTLSQIPTTGLTISQLIQLSQRSHTGRRDFTLKGAVVNHNIVFESHGDPTMGDESVYPDLSLETVHYLIFQTPAININTGGNSIYSFVGSISGNYLFWPKASDPFANRLGSRKTQADTYLDKQVSTLTKESTTSWYDPLLELGADTAKGIVSGIAASANPILGTITNWGFNKAKELLGSHTRAIAAAPTRAMLMDSVDSRRKRVTMVTGPSAHVYVSKRQALYTLSRLIECCSASLTSEQNQEILAFRDKCEAFSDWWDRQDDYYDDSPQKASQRTASVEKRSSPKVEELITMLKHMENDSKPDDSFQRK